jgi:hypothetical protein
VRIGSASIADFRVLPLKWNDPVVGVAPPCLPYTDFGATTAIGLSRQDRSLIVQRRVFLFPFFSLDMMATHKTYTRP